MHSEPYAPRSYCACDSWKARPIDPKLNASKLWATKHLAHREKRTEGRWTLQASVLFPHYKWCPEIKTPKEDGLGRRETCWKQDVSWVQTGLYKAVVALVVVSLSSLLISSPWEGFGACGIQVGAEKIINAIHLLSVYIRDGNLHQWADSIHISIRCHRCRTLTIRRRP